MQESQLAGKKRGRKPKAHGRRARHPAAAVRAMPAELSNHVVTVKKVADIAKDKKSRRIGGRISPKQVALARRKAGIRSDSDLIEAGLLALATEDDFGRWLIAQGGRLDKDLDLGP